MNDTGQLRLINLINKACLLTDGKALAMSRAKIFTVSPPSLNLLAK